MTRKRTAEWQKLQAELSAAFPSTNSKAAADIDEILTLMKRGMAGGKNMPPSTSRLIQNAADVGSNAALLRKGKKRKEIEENTIKLHNQKKQREASARYQTYRDIEARLKANHPVLRRAKPYHLAQLVQAELKRRRGFIVTTRTIVKALAKK